MPSTPVIKRRRRICSEAFVVFCIALALCAILNGYSIRHRLKLEQVLMERTIDEKADQVVRVISRLLYKTQALAALVVQNNGAIRDFDRVAATIVDDPCILNILVAPEGIVSDIYPFAGNEAARGFNMFGPSAGNKEAILARDTAQLVMGGPFTAVQGVQALVGRLPVDTVGPDGQKKFWGLVSVTLRYPEALKSTGLDQLET